MGQVLFVKVDAVVVLTTSITATTRVLTVLANATVTSGDLATLLTMLLQTSGLTNGISSTIQRASTRM